MKRPLTILPPKTAMRADKLFKNQNMDKTIGYLVQVGFKVTIKIECEDEQEILAHLAVIRREYKKTSQERERYNS